MEQQALDIIHSFIQSYGLMAIFLIFFIKGLLLGRVIPPSILIPSITIFFVDDIYTGLVILMITTIGTTCGQYTVYFIISTYGEQFIYENKLIPLSDEKVSRSIEIFDQKGNISVTLGNMTPLFHGLMIIPAALSDSDDYKFPFYSFIGSFTYFGILMLFSVGFMKALPFV